MKKILLCVSAAVMLLTACNKDEDEDPGPVTPTIANITGSYKITASTFGGVNIFDNPNQSQNLYEACQRDDVYTYSSYQSPSTSGTLTITDAGTVCSPSGSDVGTWALNNSTSINIDGSDWTITSFNGQKLVVTMTFQGTAIVETYQKQ